MWANKEVFSEHFAGDEFKEHLSALIQPGTWSDEWEIKALGSLLDVNIDVYQTNQGNLTNRPMGQYRLEDTLDTIYLVYTSASDEEGASKNHYHYLIKAPFISQTNLLPFLLKNDGLAANKKWQEFSDENEQLDLEENEAELFSYSNLHRELINEQNNPKGNKVLVKEIKGITCEARRGTKGPFLRGINFIYFMTEPVSHNTEQASHHYKDAEEGAAFKKRKLKFHIALSEDDSNLRAAGWDYVRDILIKYAVAFSKVLREGIKMSESQLAGQEVGGQRGKDITIYADNNPNLGFDNWMEIINEITQTFKERDIPGGMLPATEGNRGCKLILNNPYCTYRYEADDKPENTDNSDPFGDRLNSLDSSLLTWDATVEINTLPRATAELIEETSPDISMHQLQQIDVSSTDEGQTENKTINCCNMQ